MAIKFVGIQLRFIIDLWIVYCY